MVRVRHEAAPLAQASAATAPSAAVVFDFRVLFCFRDARSDCGSLLRFPRMASLAPQVAPQCVGAYGFVWLIQPDSGSRPLALSAQICRRRPWTNEICRMSCARIYVSCVVRCQRADSSSAQ
jgi:hypothetical protein